MSNGGPKYLWLAILFVAIGIGNIQARAGEAPAEDDQDIKKWRVPLAVKASDEDGDKLSFKWTQVSGPVVKIADPNSNDTYFVPTEPAVYEFQISVSDGKAEAVATVKKVVTRPNIEPVAVPRGPNGVDKFELGQRVVVTAGESYDKDGKITAYDWRQASGPGLTLTKEQLTDRQFFFDPKEPGDYVFELKVSDGKAWSKPAQVTITVAAANHKPILITEAKEEEHALPLDPPQVHIEAPKVDTLPIPIVNEGGVIAPGDKIVLDGSGSKDPLGEELEFFWTQVEDGNAPILRTLRHDPSSALGERQKQFDCPIWFAFPKEPGTYKFVLELSAGKGDKKRVASSKPVIFIIRGQNARPVAKIFLAKTVFETGQEVVLDGSGSRDLDGAKLTYIWSYSGKGLRPTPILMEGAKAKFEAKNEGSYGIQLIVSDGKLQSEPERVTVEVGPANRRPIVRIPSNLVRGTIGQEVKVEAIIEDPDNDRTDVTWKVIDPKDLVLSKEVLSANPLIFVPEKALLYVFEVVASDAGGPGNPGTVQVAIADKKNQVPSAVIEGPKVVTLGAEIVFSGKQSSDPEGKRLTYRWKQVGEPTISRNVPGPSEAEWKLKPEKAGEYTVSLVVSDGLSDSEPNTFAFTVAQGNHAPVARIEPPAVVNAGDETWLDGSVSSDPDEDAITYRWRVLDTTEAVEIKDPDKAKLRVITKTPGTLTFELIVSDGKLESVPKTVVLEIRRRNQAPIAKPSGPERVEVDQDVELTAKQSTDPDGDKIVAYQWTQAKGGSHDLGLNEKELQAETLRFRPGKTGTYSFELIVTDQGGMKSLPGVWSLTVIGRVPEAQLEVLGEGPFQVGQQVVLSAQKSRDPDGRPLTYTWRQVGAEQLTVPEDATETMSVVPDKVGEYTFELVVRNGDRESRPVSATFKVVPGDQPPVAVISEVASCSPGGKITLDASQSKDPEGKNLEYRWEALSMPENGKVSLGWRGYKRASLEVKLPAEGTYKFSLKVFDGKLWSEPVEVSVTTRPLNRAPTAVARPMLVASAGADEESSALLTPAQSGEMHTEERREVVLDGGQSTDPDSGPEPLSYQWKQISGTPPEKLVEEEAGKRLRFVPTQPGQNLWELIVSDGGANSEPSRVKIIVLKAGALPVAVPDRRVINTGVATRGLETDPNIVILDGSRSYAAEQKPLHYSWRQLGGEDLGLRAEALAKPKVGLKIYHPGKYRFILTVHDGEYGSLPSTVDIIVREPALVAPPEKKDQNGPESRDGAKLNLDESLLPPPRDAREGPFTAKMETDKSDGHLPKPKKPIEPIPVAVSDDAEEKTDGTSKSEGPQTKSADENRIVQNPAKEENGIELKPVPIPIENTVHTGIPTAPLEEKKDAPAVSSDEALLPPPTENEAKNETAVAPGQEVQTDLTVAMESKESATATTEYHGIEKKLRDPKYRSDDPLFQARRQEILVLIQEPGRKAEEQLIRSLNKRDEDLASLAAVALVRRGMGSVPALIAALETGRENTQQKSQWALEQLSGKALGSDPKKWKEWWARQIGQPAE